MLNSECGSVLVGPDTITVPASLLRPVAETATVAVPLVVGVKSNTATPLVAAIGDDGENDPETPVTDIEMELFAFVTVFEFASWMVAVYCTGTPVAVVACAGVKMILVGGVGANATCKVAVALPNPCEDAVIVAVPAVCAVKLEVAVPAVGVIGDSIVEGLNEPVTPLTENVTGFVAVVTGLLFASRIVAV